MFRLIPLCLALFGAFGKHSPPLHGATCDEEAQDEFSTLQVASKLQSIAAEEVQKRDDTKIMKNKEDEGDEDEQVDDEEDEAGEDEEDETGEDEDKEDAEAVAALQTASRRRRRRGAGAGRRRRRTVVAALQTESLQENPYIQDDVIFLDQIESLAAEEVQKRDDTKIMKNKEDEGDEDEQVEDEEDEAGEDEEDETGEGEDKKDAEAVAALQTASRRRRGGPNAGSDMTAHRRRSQRRWGAGAGRRRWRTEVAALQTESLQENPHIQDDVIFLDQIEDKFGAYMRALREFQSNRELLTRQDKQATVNELRQWAVAEADEMMMLSDLVAVNEAELEGEEDNEEDHEEADHDEYDEEAAGEEDSNTDQETTLDTPALTSEMAPNQPDGNLLQTDVASRRRGGDNHRRRFGSGDRRRFFTGRRRRDCYTWEEDKNCRRRQSYCSKKVWGPCKE